MLCASRYLVNSNGAKCEVNHSPDSQCASAQTTLEVVENAAEKKQHEEEAAARRKAEEEAATTKRHEEEAAKAKAERELTEEHQDKVKAEEETAAKHKAEEEAKSASLLSPPLSPAPVATPATPQVAVLGATAVKPLTASQKLHTALAKCKKQYKHNKKKRIVCETHAKKKYGPKPKRH